MLGEGRNYRRSSETGSGIEQSSEQMIIWFAFLCQGYTWRYFTAIGPQASGLNDQTVGQRQWSTIWFCSQIHGLKGLNNIFLVVPWEVQRQSGLCRYLSLRLTCGLVFLIGNREIVCLVVHPSTVIRNPNTGCLFKKNPPCRI